MSYKSIVSTLSIVVAITFTSNDLAAQSPGDTVGTTKMVRQSNGSSGDRIALDSQGGLHFVWMDVIGNTDRQEVFYNYRGNDGRWMGGVIIDDRSYVGYCQLDIKSDDCAAVAYHSTEFEYVIYGRDFFSGFGVFELYSIPDHLSSQCFWPYLAVDRTDRIHVVMRESPPDPGDQAAIGYTRSSDGGVTWSDLVPVDTILTVSHVIAASPISDKVAIVYSHTIIPDDRAINDIFYIESLDGINWDWTNGKINVTEYGQDGDSLYAYTDLDAIYDYDDNLHIIWNANWVTSAGISDVNFLYHYNSRSGTISLVDSVDIDLGECQGYPWNRSINKMTMGVEEESGTIFTVYTRFNPDDCSSGRFANGDLIMQYSIDGGHSWTIPWNITDTRSPDCLPGDCDSELWPSLADRVTDDLHIFYVVDIAGGGYWEGSNPLLYLRYPTIPVEIEPEPTIPGSFSLYQNYPNPFNTSTTIEFELDHSTSVELAIYDITGALVDELYSGWMEAGRQSIVWDSHGVSSGAYFYKLSTAESSLVRKMLLLK